MKDYEVHRIKEKVTNALLGINMNDSVVKSHTENALEKLKAEGIIGDYNYTWEYPNVKVSIRTNTVFKEMENYFGNMKNDNSDIIYFVINIGIN